MEKMYIIVAVVLTALLTIKIIDARSKLGKKGSDVFYKVKGKFFNDSELQFFEELEKQNNGKCHIFSKVRLEDIVEVVEGLGRKVAYGKRNSIKSRHVDFVLVSKVSGQVVKAIELDGGYHKGKRQSDSDEKKDNVCEQAGINLERIEDSDDFEMKISKIMSQINN